MLRSISTCPISLFSKTSLLSSSQPSQFSNSSKQGFTIIELLITVTIIGILMSIATPSFHNIVKRTQLKTLSLNLHSTLKQARNHAINNQVIVIVCQSNAKNFNQCNPNRQRYANWRNGWISFADVNNNNELDSNDHIINTHQTKGQTNVIFNQSGRLRFFPRGSARSAGFYFCNKKSLHTQYIRLLHTGRSRISQNLSKKQLSKCLN